MSASSSGPVGSWTGTVSYDKQVDAYTANFADDGSVSMDTEKSSGSGNWTATESDAFHFTVREVFKGQQISPTGKTVAYIQIEVDARLSGSEFSGSGKATVYGTDGSVVYSTVAETTARRSG
ncbi:dehydrogenase [Streptomyces sp. TRM43335]|uniref:Dehydrogenase n=1 Tax=Streptomyces taklimakanensis TaxID=2569853 RepID=A0A6G2BG01_9ACTN|nr:dehydrogenase [Streptomyces taklimakanensis]MTE20999.1 dehydrogenase [Streptomyces taklimakanensis]